MGKKNYYELSFESFMVGLRSLNETFEPLNKWDLEILERRFKDTNIVPYQFKVWFREGYKDGSINFSDISDPVVVYVRRLLGHKINEKFFFKHPRFAVLYSLCILKDRWRAAEQYIVKDEFASYLYSKYVVCGLLPEKMHTEIVMKTFLRKTYLTQIYLAENEGLQRKKLCYN
jgi:hypothetical protein